MSSVAGPACSFGRRGAGGSSTPKGQRSRNPEWPSEAKTKGTKGVASCSEVKRAEQSLHPTRLACTLFEEHRRRILSDVSTVTEDGGEAHPVRIGDSLSGA